MLVTASCSLFAATSTITKYDYHNPDNGLAIWLKPSWQSNAMQKYVFINETGTFEDFSNGTAIITGTLLNLNDAQEMWSITINLKGKRDWISHSANNGSFCDPSKITAGQHKAWTYYDVDDSKSNKMVDISGKCGGVVLIISGSSSCGFQIGHGANGVNSINGLGGQFSASGADDVGTVFSTKGGFCTAICPNQEVKDYYKAFRFDHLDVKPYTHALYINDDSLGVLRYIFGSKGGHLSTYHDGSAHLYGEVYLISNNANGVDWYPDLDKKFELNIYLKDAKNWQQWSSNPNNDFYDTYEVADGKHVSWTYYLFDDTKPNTLRGLEDYKGTVLYLSHQPADLSLGVQFGQNATAQNVKVFGVGGWFTYTVGKTKSNFAGGRGDVNMYLDRECESGDYLFGIKGGKSKKNTRIYYLNESNAHIESSEIEHKSAALAAKPNSSLLYYIQNKHPYNLVMYDLASGYYETVGKTGFCNNVYRLDFNSTGELYASRGAKLYTINTTTGKASFLGKMKGFANKKGKSRGDIAFSPNGSLYLLTKTHLYTVNQSTYRVTSVGKHGISLISGMDFNSSGDLVVSNIIKEKGVGVHSNLYEMNANDATSTLIGDTKVRLNDLAYFSGCYAEANTRKIDCSNPSQGGRPRPGPGGSRSSDIADENGVIEYDDDFSDLEDDEDLIAMEELENIKLYPSLVGKFSSDYVTITSSVEYENVNFSITDGVGRTYRSDVIPYLMGENTIGISDLPNGVYFFQVGIGENSKLFKVLINK